MASQSKLQEFKRREIVMFSRTKAKEKYIFFKVWLRFTLDMLPLLTLLNYSYCQHQVNSSAAEIDTYISLQGRGL
jgi:hypothetical protein